MVKNAYFASTSTNVIRQPMIHQIYPCLWFDNQAKAAAEFYCSIFPDSKITQESSVAVQFEIGGKKMMGLNGGPMFSINPSISLFVTCTSTHEIEEIWELLSEGGSAMMPLDKYPWSEKYGWVIDKFGMTWQLMLGELQPFEQKIMPSLLFVGEQFGQGAEAIRKYVSLFQNSKIHHLEMAANGESDNNQHLAFGRFELNGAQFAAMDGPGNHEFQFNEGVSLVVECETQDEIDYLWDHLTHDGGVEVQCGWLRDSHGISWQIIPSMLGSLMSDPEKGERVMQKVMKMKKLDLNILLNA